MIAPRVRLHRSVDPRPVPPMGGLQAATRELFMRSFRDSIMVRLPFMDALAAYKRGPRDYANWLLRAAIAQKQSRMHPFACVGPEDDYDSYMEE